MWSCVSIFLRWMHSGGPAWSWSRCGSVIVQKCLSGVMLSHTPMGNTLLMEAQSSRQSKQY